jgi:type II secretory pathway predicted ATPase ExeA
LYLRYFNFNAKPFAMNPDPAFLYRSEQHSRALTMLEYAIESQASFCLLTGDIGCGKTTLIRHLIRMLGDQVTVGLVSNTHGRFRSIHPWALSALGIAARDASDIAQFEALNEFFIREYGKGHRTLLIFDEAQNLSVRTLEELRLLSNVNSEKDVALQILLVGQPELREKMARPELKQFAQRVAVDYHLQSLDLAEAQAYIRHRLTVAGGSDSLFQRKAIEFLHARSGGIPRLINQLCDMALVYAFAERCKRIDAALVEKVLEDRSHGRARSLFHEEPASLNAGAEDAPSVTPPAATPDSEAVREHT